MKSIGHDHLDAATPHLLIHGVDAGLQHVVTASLEEARTYAEFLMNQRGDNSSRVFEMREVGISFKTYYQVQLADRPTPPPPAVEKPVDPNEPKQVQPRVVPISA